MRKLIAEDPEFSPGSQHTAHAPMSNPTPAGWTYEAEVYLVRDETKEATSGLITFTLSPSGSGTVDFPVTMPAAEGTYQVYLDVYVGGESLAQYQTVDDVVIKEVLVPFAYSNLGYEVEIVDGGPMASFRATVTNPSDKTVTNEVVIWVEEKTHDWGPRITDRRTITLGPGQSTTYYCHWCQMCFWDNERFYFWFADNAGGESAHKRFYV